MLAGASDLDIDEDRIGMSGHSFGGWTTLKTVEKDTRIKAIVPLAPAGGGEVNDENGHELRGSLFYVAQSSNSLSVTS